MNWLDIVVIVVMVGLTLAAYSAGLIREVVTFFAVIIGIVVAGALYERLARDVLVFVDNEDAAEAVSFLALFGAVYLFGQIGAYVLKTGAALLMLGPLDHLGGAVFGFVKGIIVAQTLLVIFAAYPSLDMDQAVADSTVARRLADDYGVVRYVVPDHIQDKFDLFQHPEEETPTEGEEEPAE
jgi:membrane protein required for colicin V production